MALTRSQIITQIEDLITDPLLSQNTAVRMRTALILLINNLVSLDDGVGGGTLKGNFEAVAAPSTTDDSSNGYSKGSHWIFGTDVYICKDNAVGTAVWVLETQAAATSNFASLQGLASDNASLVTYVAAQIAALSIEGQSLGHFVEGGTARPPANQHINDLLFYTKTSTTPQELWRQQSDGTNWVDNLKFDTSVAQVTFGTIAGTAAEGNDPRIGTLIADDTGASTGKIQTILPNGKKGWVIGLDALHYYYPAPNLNSLINTDWDTLFNLTAHRRRFVISEKRDYFFYDTEWNNTPPDVVPLNRPQNANGGWYKEANDASGVGVNPLAQDLTNPNATDVLSTQGVQNAINAIASSGLDAASKWKPNTVYTPDNPISFSPTQAAPIDIDGNPLETGKLYVGRYKVGTTSSASLTLAEIAKIEVARSISDNTVALQALAISNNVQTQVNLLPPEERAFTPAMTFDRDVTYDGVYQQSGALTISKVAAGSLNGKTHALHLAANGDAINVPSNYIELTKGMIAYMVANPATYEVMFFNYQTANIDKVWMTAPLASSGASANTNQIATATTLSVNTIAENTVANSVIATISSDGIPNATSYVLAGADAAHFNVFDAGGGIFQLRNTTVFNFESPVDAGSNNTYDITLAAVNSEGTQAAPSAIQVTVTDVVEVGLPSVPLNLVASADASANDTQIFLSWDKPANDGGAQVTSYVIEQESPVGGGWSVINAAYASTLASIVNYSVTGLTASTQYNFRVSATNTAGTGGSGNESNITTQAGVFIPTSIPWITYHESNQGFTLDGTSTSYVSLSCQVHDVNTDPTSSVFDLNQNIQAMQPLYRADYFGAGKHGFEMLDGKMFDSAEFATYLGGGVTQPSTRILVLGWDTAPRELGILVSSVSSSARNDVYIDATGKIGMYAGAPGPAYNSYVSQNSDKKLIIFEYNGANSKVIVQGVEEVTPTGSQTHTGTKFGWSSNLSLSGHAVIGIHGYIGRLLTATEKSNLLNYFNANYQTA